VPSNAIVIWRTTELSVACYLLTSFLMQLPWRRRHGIVSFVSGSPAKSTMQHTKTMRTVNHGNCRKLSSCGSVRNCDETIERTCARRETLATQWHLRNFYFISRTMVEFHMHSTWKLLRKWNVFFTSLGRWIFLLHTFHNPHTFLPEGCLYITCSGFTFRSTDCTYFTPNFAKWNAFYLSASLCFNGAGIATAYGLDDRGFGVRVPIGSRIFSTSSRLTLVST
jgi:hypothetical protein